MEKFKSGILLGLQALVVDTYGLNRAVYLVFQDKDNLHCRRREVLCQWTCSNFSWVHSCDAMACCCRWKSATNCCWRNNYISWSGTLSGKHLKAVPNEVGISLTICIIDTLFSVKKLQIPTCFHSQLVLIKLTTIPVGIHKQHCHP